VGRHAKVQAQDHQNEVQTGAGLHDRASGRDCTGCRLPGARGLVRIFIIGTNLERLEYFSLLQ